MSTGCNKNKPACLAGVFRQIIVSSTEITSKPIFLLYVSSLKTNERGGADSDIAWWDLAWDFPVFIRCFYWTEQGCAAGWVFQLREIWGVPILRNAIYKATWYWVYYIRLWLVVAVQVFRVRYFTSLSIQVSLDGNVRNWTGGHLQRKHALYY